MKRTDGDQGHCERTQRCNKLKGKEGPLREPSTAPTEAANYNYGSIARAEPMVTEDQKVPPFPPRGLDLSFSCNKEKAPRAGGLA